MGGKLERSGPVLEVRSLAKRFGANVAVDDVSFQVEQGSFVSLLGPSGSGKTTILRMVAGFETPSAGDILLNGDRINQQRPHQRSVSTVFQQYALFPHMSVFDNIAFGLECRRLARPEIEIRVQEILGLTQLAGKDARRVQTLSGGEQQRVALARSLVTNPTLLLLDEPLGALDFKLRREMATELKRLHGHLNMTFLYVTHDQEEALSMSDKVIVMYGGRILQTGTPADIYWRPRSRLVADFLGGANVLTGNVLEVRDGVAKIALSDSDDHAMVGIEDDPVDIGCPISFAVRGERVAVDDETTGMDNVLIGTLDDFRFYGSTTELEVRLGGGQSLRIRRSGKSSPGDRSIGKMIRLGWNADDAIPVTHDDVR